MKYSEIIKRAFQITIRNKALWLFGFLLALTGGGRGGGGGGGSGNYNFGNGGFKDSELQKIIPQTPPNFDPSAILPIILGLVCLGLLVAIAFAVIHYVSQTAVIGMVKEIDDGQTATIRQGWKIGWSKKALRVFLISLLLGIPLAIVIILLLVIGLSPLLLLLAKQTAIKVLGVVLAVGLILLMIPIMIVIGTVIQLILELGWRNAVLKDGAVIESISAAFKLFKSKFKNVAIMWLLMLGIGIAWGIVSLLLGMVLLLAGAMVGIIPGLLTYLVSHSGWMALGAGSLLALIPIILISLFVQGLFLVFQSSVWTLTFREITSEEATVEGEVEVQPAS